MAHKDQDYLQTQALIADQDYEPDEITVLHLSRLYFLAHIDPIRPHWDAAIDHSEQTFGMEDGHMVAYCVAEVLQNMRQSRKTAFLFTKPLLRPMRGAPHRQRTAFDKHHQRRPEG